MIRPETAGFYGGGAWFILLLVPAVGLRKASELAARQRYTAARRLISGLRFLHPGGDLPAQLYLVQAMEFSQHGDIAAATRLLNNLRNARSNVAHQAMAQLFRINGDWRGLLGWIQGHFISGGVLS